MKSWVQLQEQCQKVVVAQLQERPGASRASVSGAAAGAGVASAELGQIILLDVQRCSEEVLGSAAGAMAEGGPGAASCVYVCGRAPRGSIRPLWLKRVEL